MEYEVRSKNKALIFDDMMKNEAIGIRYYTTCIEEYAYVIVK
jgi:hypothetical protein